MGQFFYPFADVAVLRSENTSDKQLIVHTLSLKEGFFWGIYKKRGLGLLEHNRKKAKKNNRVRVYVLVL